MTNSVELDRPANAGFFPLSTLVLHQPMAESVSHGSGDRFEKPTKGEQAIFVILM
jgi:hypothetical protein